MESVRSAAALHCCKQCNYFDPSTRFQCAKPIPVRIAIKDKANECTLFKPRVTVARDGVSANGNSHAAHPPRQPARQRRATPTMRAPSTCEQSKVFSSDRACFSACGRDAYGIPQAQAAFARAWWKQRSDAVPGLCSSATRKGWFGYRFKSGASGRHASTIHERGGDVAAGSRPGQGCA